MNLLISDLEKSLCNKIKKYLDRGFTDLTIVIAPNLEKKMKKVNVRLNIEENFDFPIVVDDDFKDNMLEVEVNGS